MKLLSLLALAVFFIAAGANHFWHPAAYVRIMPPWLPAHALLVQISGAAEIAGGIGMLVPALRWYAALCLVALLIAVFPANLQMALHPQLYAGVASPALLYARLPLQGVLIVWVWWTR
ncbi:MAG: DoxX family membrane protein [Candidatus Baltobacteraceae bacterium]